MKKKLMSSGKYGELKYNYVCGMMHIILNVRD